VTEPLKILSVDVESNGLHGEPFAIGAVCTDGDYNLICDGSAYLHSAACHANGTHVLTIKGRRTR
jgi:hypothetical protein